MAVQRFVIGMNLEKLQAKLIAAARGNPPGDHVPFAFEKRIMARLAKPMVDAWLIWGRALWRAAATCLLAVGLLGSWSLQMESKESADLLQDFEETVLAALDDQPTIELGEEIW